MFLCVHHDELQSTHSCATLYSPEGITLGVVIDTFTQMLNQHFETELELHRRTGPYCMKLGGLLLTEATPELLEKSRQFDD